MVLNQNHEGPSLSQMSLNRQNHRKILYSLSEHVARNNNTTEQHSKKFFYENVLHVPEKVERRGVNLHHQVNKSNSSLQVTNQSICKSAKQSSQR